MRAVLGQMNNSTLNQPNSSWDKPGTGEVGPRFGAADERWKH